MSFKKLVRPLAFATFLILSLLNSSHTSAANPNFSRSVLLSPRDGQALFNSYFSENPVFTKLPHYHPLPITHWIPTSVDVAQVQDALWKYEALGADAIDPKWNEFEVGPHAIVLTTDIRQYAGVTINGKKHILIIGSASAGNITDIKIFNTNHLGDYRTNRSSYFTDGGSAFQAVYDPVRCRLEHLFFDHFVERKAPMFTL